MSDEEKIQVIILHLDDGRRLVFSGRAYPDIEGHKVVKVDFIEPQTLAPDCHLEPLESVLSKTQISAILANVGAKVK